MENREAYVTISLDRKGNIVEVRLKGKDPIKPQEGKPGLLRDGSVAPGCEKVARYLVHELLVCGKKGHAGGAGGGSGSGTESGKDNEPGSGKESGSDGGDSTGSDPCCYRDPFTGRIWCWC